MTLKSFITISLMCFRDDGMQRRGNSYKINLNRQAPQSSDIMLYAHNAHSIAV